MSRISSPDFLLGLQKDFNSLVDPICNIRQQLANRANPRLEKVLVWAKAINTATGNLITKIEEELNADT
jgi:hypothetical protein